MWIEAIFEKGDVERLLAQLMPLTIRLGDDEDTLTLDTPGDVAFVAGEGLRMGCEARLRWSLLGIDIPITIHAVRVMLRPTILRGADGVDTLAFRLFIEHADVAGLPTMADEHLTDKVNAALEQRHEEMRLDLAALVADSFALPAGLRPLASVSMSMAWAKLRVSDEALVLAISLNATVNRETDSAARPAASPVPFPVAPSPALAVVPPGAIARPSAGVLAVGGASLAVAFGAAYALGARRRRWI